MDPFDPPLGPEPGLALLPPVVEPVQVGPAYRVQLVVELVGPRSAPASAVAQLLATNWQNALGQPESFCMSPADITWQPLTDQRNGSYDSIALCWDILSAKGELSTSSAQHLLRQCESFGNAIGRRAMPLPVPNEVNRFAKELNRIQNQLDVGVSLAVIAKSGAVFERDLWVACSRLGLEFSPSGSFDWRSSNHPSPLLSVTPIGDTDSFSLGAVHKGARHEGVTVGFNVPRCPSPMAALDGALRVCEAIAQATDGVTLDDNARLLTPLITDEMRRNLQIAVEALEQVGMKPGSAPALRLF
jgi:hypothetical protein